MSVSALDRYTEKLPYIETVDIDAPEPIGKSTANAMKSGMFWGTVGAIRELTALISQSLTPRPRIFLTGGDGRTLAPFLSHAEHVPHMVLRGIATTAAGSGFANG